MKYAELFRAGGSSPPGVAGANPDFLGVLAVYDLGMLGTWEYASSKWSRLGRCLGMESVCIPPPLSRPGENAADLAEYRGTGLPGSAGPGPCRICSHALKSFVFALASSPLACAHDPLVPVAEGTYDRLLPAGGGGGGNGFLGKGGGCRGGGAGALVCGDLGGGLGGRDGGVKVYKGVALMRSESYLAR